MVGRKRRPGMISGNGHLRRPRGRPRTPLTQQLALMSLFLCFCDARYRQRGRQSPAWQLLSEFRRAHKNDIRAYGFVGSMHKGQRDKIPTEEGIRDALKPARKAMRETREKTLQILRHKLASFSIGELRMESKLSLIDYVYLVDDSVKWLPHEQAVRRALGLCRFWQDPGHTRTFLGVYSRQ